MPDNKNKVESIATDLEDELRLEIAELDDECLDDVTGGAFDIVINFGCSR